MNARATHTKLHVFPAELCAAVHKEIVLEGKESLRNAVLRILLQWGDDKVAPSSPPADVATTHMQPAKCSSPPAKSPRPSTPFDKLEESFCLKQVKRQRSLDLLPDVSDEEANVELSVHVGLEARKRQVLPSV